MPNGGRSIIERVTAYRNSINTMYEQQTRTPHNPNSYAQNTSFAAFYRYSKPAHKGVENVAVLQRHRPRTRLILLLLRIPARGNAVSSPYRVARISQEPGSNRLLQLRVRKFLRAAMFRVHLVLAYVPFWNVRKVSALPSGYGTLGSLAVFSKTTMANLGPHASFWACFSIGV